jgi:membrane protein
VPRTLISYLFTFCALLYAAVASGVLIVTRYPSEGRAAVGVGGDHRAAALAAGAGHDRLRLCRALPLRPQSRPGPLALGVDRRGRGLGGMAVRLAGLFVLLANIAHYDATYGPLGAVIAFMVWVWFSIMAILVGAELNAEIEHQTAVDSTTGPEQPMGARGAAMADTVGLAFHPWEMIKREAGMVRRVTGGAWNKVRRR